jgi:pimeloyl-ACP methyl ester carboxylesterase
MNVFKSAEGREKIRSYYNGILSYFPLKQSFVDTSFGRTFVIEAGNAEKPAVVLLHGSCSNSAAWLGDIPALAADYHVFAVDTIGEAGNSDENRLALDNDGYPGWLKEVLDALDIGRAVIVGNSMGGWLALHFAASYAERILAMILLAPSGIISPKQTFLDQTEDISENPDKAEAVGASIMGDVQIPREVLEFMALVLENFNPFTGALPSLTDEQMQALTMPILFMAGTEDVTMDSAQAARRLLRFAPHAKVQIVKGAHVIVNAAGSIMTFLAEEL